MPRLAMGGALFLRRALISVAGVLAFMIMVIAAIGWALESGYFRGPLIRYFAFSSGRPLTVDGSLKVRVLSLHPRVIAERLAIGNPAWMPPGNTAEIDKAAALVKVREEQKRREVEQARADEERKRREAEQATTREEARRCLLRLPAGSCGTQRGVTGQ